MGEVNRLRGTIRGGQFHVASLAAGIHPPASRGPGGSLPAPWVDINRHTSLDSPTTGTGSQRKVPTPIVVQPLGWYNEPLTVVMHGDDAPACDRLYVGRTCAAV